MAARAGADYVGRGADGELRTRTSLHGGGADEISRRDLPPITSPGGRSAIRDLVRRPPAPVHAGRVAMLSDQHHAHVVRARARRHGGVVGRT